MTQLGFDDAEGKIRLIETHLSRLEQALQDEYTWVRALYHEVQAEGDGLEPGYLEALEAVLLDNRRQYGILLGGLLSLEMDLTRVFKALEQLDRGIGDYRQFVARLKARKAH